MRAAEIERAHRRVTILGSGPGRNDGDRGGKRQTSCAHSCRFVASEPKPAVVPPSAEDGEP